MLAFQDPHPVEQEPRVIEHMLVLIKSKLPISREMVPQDVTEMSFVRTISKELSVGITLYNEDAGGLTGEYPVYELTIEEHQFHNKNSDFPILSKYRAIVIEEDSMDVRLVQDNEIRFDEEGHTIVNPTEASEDDNDADDNSGLNTSQLAEMIMTLEKVPDRWVVSADES